MEKIERLNEMFSILNERGIVKNKKDMAQLIGVNYSTLVSAFSGDERYLTKSLLAKVAALTENYKENTNSDKVPLIPTEARGGSLGDFAQQVHLYNCELITSPIKGATYAIQVTGDSMSPEYPNGSQVLLKQVNEKAFIEWGKCYCLDTDYGAVIKIIRKTDKYDVIECISLNPAFQPFTVETKYIKGWYRVLMVMSLK